MGDIFFKGESIECQSAHLAGKKIVPGAMIKHQQLGMLRKFSIERDGFAEVIKELSPKVAIYKDTSKLSVGEKLSCQKFFALSQELTLKFKKAAFSGRHNIQETHTSKFTYAEISYPFEHIVHAIEKRDQTHIR